MALVSAGHADLTALTLWALLCCVLSSQKTVFSPQRHHYTQSPCWFILERYKWCGHRRLWNMSKQNSRNSRGKSCEVLRCVPRKHDKTSQTMKKEQPYTTAACAVGAVTETAGRDSSRYRYSGNRRTRQLLTLDCECSWVTSTNDVYENTWKGGLSLRFIFPHQPSVLKKKKKAHVASI